MARSADLTRRPQHREWRFVILFVALCGFTLFGGPSNGQSPSGQSVVVVAAKSAAARSADHIKDLIAGRLPANIEAEPLFALPLGTADAVRTRAVLAMIGDARLYDAARSDAASLIGLSADEAALAIAQAEFLRLSAARRDALLAKHHQAVEQATDAARQAKLTSERIAGLKRTQAGLLAFLAGQKTDPTILTIDALASGNPVLSSERRSRLLTAAPVSTGSAMAPTDDPDILTQQIDNLRARILALTPGDRARLAAAQETAPSASAVADEAGRQAAASTLAAEQARNETQRLLATERARLLRVREAQSRAQADLEQGKNIATQAREAALRWRRQVRELLDRPRSDAMKPVDADRLYFQLVNALKAMRTELHGALGKSSALKDAQLTPQPLDNGLPPNNTQSKALSQLYTDLTGDLVRLHMLEDAIRSDRRDAIYSAMTDMNEVRLSLIPSLSSAMRARITGFGNEGFAQVQREANQMALSVRYTFASGLQRAARALEPFLSPSPQLVLSMLRLMLVALVFRYWRKRGDTILALAETSNVERRPPTMVSTALGLTLGYLRQVRRPLDWLLFLIIFYWLLPAELDLAGIRFAWIIGWWVLFAAFMVRLLDVLARGNRADDPRSALRQKSLRLVAGVVLSVGLMLSLTNQSVGKGAIYNWVFSACWLLLVPVALILASWWKQRIHALAEAAGASSPILAWSARRQEGLLGNAVSAIAGIVLMVAGARTIVMRRINEFALIRELSDQRQRVRAAARVAADAESGRFAPVSNEILDVLAPHRTPITVDPSKRGFGRPDVPLIASGAIVALVGERGLGKTTTLRDLAHDISGASDEGVMRISVIALGFQGICSQLAERLGCDALPADILRAFSARPGRIVMVDDLQRLVVPAIGGLEDFDRLVALARTTSPGTSWIFSIGGPAWTYLRRARGDRAIFDRVDLLPRWNVVELRDLIERRTMQAGIAPVFDPLETAGTIALDADLSPEERTKRAYFSELTDYSAGNPAVALEFWRRSLFLDNETGKVVVRTYRTPDAAALAALPQTAIFVLRTVLQMEVAQADDIERCTDLGVVAISDALHILKRMGVIAPYEHGFRVTLFWYRDVRRLLERQNLLGRIAA